MSSVDRVPGPDEVSLVALASSILRRRRLVVAWGAALFTMVVVSALIRPRVYTAGASFIPSVVPQGAGLSGLAAQIGLSLPTGEASESPDFYANLVRSRGVLGTVVNERFSYRTVSGTVNSTLLDVLEITAVDSLRRRELGIRALGNMIAATVDKRTGVVKVSATSRHPALSELLVERIIGEVNRFNLERRQLRAKAERVFTEHRLDEVRVELRASEDSLAGFLTRNRDYRNSPLLVFQAQRLERNVQMRQQVYTTLSQAFEQAKLEAIRDTPVITVVEYPEVPAGPDPRGLIRRGFLSLVAGLILGMLVAVILDKLGQAGDQQPKAYEEFARLGRQTWQDLLRPWRFLARSQDRGSGPA